MSLTTTKTTAEAGLEHVSRPLSRAMSEVALQVEARQGTPALAHAELIAEIKSAFELTGRPVPENLEGIAYTARMHRFELLGVIAETQVERDYGTFLTARAEVACPALMVERLRWMALRKAEDAGYHAKLAEEFAAKAKARAEQGEPELAQLHIDTGNAHHACSQDCLAEARRLKADADLIEREGLSAFVEGRAA